MKKLFVVLAATLICGACLFPSCKKEKGLNVKEKIIGKWITEESAGHPTLTNDKKVYSFVSATKAYISASLNAGQQDIRWDKQMKPTWPSTATR